MNEMDISSIFSINGIPATGLSPVIRITEIDSGVTTLTVNDAAMTEIGDGFYTFNFDQAQGYESTKNYLVRVDGGNTLTDRYQAQEINPIESTIINGVLDEPLNQHQTNGSVGASLADTLANTAGLLIDVADVDAIVQLTLKYNTNRTKIDNSAKTLTVYDDDCVTPLRVFALFDASNSPSTQSIFERKPTVASDGKAVCG